MITNKSNINEEKAGNDDNFENYKSNNTNEIQQNNYFAENKDNQRNKGLTLEKIVEQIENDKKYYNNTYSNDDLIKLINSFENLEEIKEKILYLESKIAELGGPTQGWINKDHQEFLKLRTQYKMKINTLDFLSDFENTLPYLNRNDLKIHINLYLKYDKYYLIKKTFLDRYKQIKENIDNDKKQNILEKVDINDKKLKLKTKDFVKNTEEKKKIVDEWKKAKEKEQTQVQQDKITVDNLFKEKEKLKFIDRVEKNKGALEEYNKNKGIEKLEKDLNEANNVIKIKKISEFDLERIREKNNFLEEKKRLIVKSKSIGIIKINENYMKYQLKKVEKMAKIESKLDYKTTATVQKQRQKHDFTNNKDAGTMSNNVLGKLSRAVPEWRKSLI